jgi:type IV pilus assembly protein PilQ
MTIKPFDKLTRRPRWSPLAIVALPALLLLALDAGPARAGPPKGEPSPAKTKAPSDKSSKTKPASKLNQIDGLSIEELDDGTTSLRLSGSKVPTFNVYRLPDPDRLVVDISSSERGKAVPHVDVDTWAVGRVTLSSIAEQDSRLTRVVVHLKRESSYIVVPKRSELVITITPKDIAPAAYFARKSAGKRKAEIESMKAEAETLRADAETKKAEAETLRADAEDRAEQAKLDAEAAEKEAARSRADAEAIRGEAEEAAREIQEDASTTLSEARKLAEARKKALADAEKEAKDAEARAAKAKKEAAAAEKAAEAARLAAAEAKAEAAKAKKEAAGVKAQAEDLLADAEEAAEAAREDRKAAAEAKRRAAGAKAEAEELLADAAELEKAARKDRKRAETEAEELLADAEKATKAAREDRKKAKAEAEELLADAEKDRKRAKADHDSAAKAKKEADGAKLAAEELLADAERMVEQAREDRDQAKTAHDAAKLALGEARKASRKVGKSDDEREEIDRAVEQAEAAAEAAKKREKEAIDRIAQLEADQARLAEARQVEQAELEELRTTVREQKAEIADARKQVEEARTAYQAYGGDRGPDSSHKREHRRAKQVLHKAEGELAKLEADAQKQRDQLADLRGSVADAEQQLSDTLATARQKSSLKRQWERDRELAGETTIRDVRFEDGPKGARVIVELDGPVIYDASSLTPNMTMLELRDTEIPVGLERSLDTTSFRGPIDRITSFREGDDVKIVVASATSDPASLELDGKSNRLIWTFPKTKRAEPELASNEEAEQPREPAKRSEVVSLGGTKVSGFSAPVYAAGPRSVGNRSRWRGERIDIELQDAPIKDVLLLFSDIGRVNIIAGPEVQGTITMKLSSVPWDQALDIILRSLQLGMVQEGNVIRVATQAELEEEQRKAIEQANAQVQLKPLETRLIPLSYATVDEMLAKVQSVLSSRGSVTPDTRTNTLIVMDVAENIALAESLVRQLDSQTPQVLIEARIVEARTNWLRQLGIQWGFDFTASPGTGNPTGLLFPNSIGAAGGSGSNLSPVRGLILPGAAANPHYAVDLPATVGTGTGGAIGFSFGSLSGNLNTNLRLSAAEEDGEVRIISAPKIVTLDNTEAQIEQGVQIPISQVSAQGVNTRYVNATLGLQVTPHVTNEGAVLLEVQVQKNEADFVNTGARGDPTILTKSAQSQLLITDGDTAVIGGIYTRNQAVNYSQVPWFADIPIIGWFFKNKVERDDRSEMLIFLTPRIVNRSTSIGGGGE